ncbi:MAG: MBOAT family protein [Syntrophobacteraceae bacterium]
MIFCSFEYIIFFIVIMLLTIIIRQNKAKKFVLLAGSCYFYAYWDYRFLLLLAGLSIANYYAGSKIASTQARAGKKRWLAASIVFDLMVLGFFKYFNFFVGSINSLMLSSKIRLPSMEIILPIGISFMTFEVISYTIDIYRGKNKPAANLLDLSLLVTFFPHLISGPILKPGHFLPQLDREITVRWKNVEKGTQIFLLGMVKKVLVADRLAFFVDPVFKAPQDYSSGTVWLAVIAYAVQIYCDFSGYTDMAIGSAKCLGFEFPPNFNMPYISKSISEFWRRWHISLSTWLKDYLYIPLGGNRKGKLRQYMNLMIVMLLGGLWHGASWNFVIWGGLHGLGLMIHKLYSDYLRPRAFSSRPYACVSWLLTMAFVCVAWVFFRSTDFAVSFIIIKKMFLIGGSKGITWYATSLFVIIPVLIISHYFGLKLGDPPYVRYENTWGCFVLFFVLFGLFYLAPLNSSPFIYFQF